MKLILTLIITLKFSYAYADEDRICTTNEHCTGVKVCNIPVGAQFGYCGYRQGTYGDLCDGDWECDSGYLCDNDSYLGTCKDEHTVECLRNPNCSIISL